MGSTCSYVTKNIDRLSLPQSQPFICQSTICPTAIACPKQKQIIQKFVTPTQTSLTGVCATRDHFNMEPANTGRINSICSSYQHLSHNILPKLPDNGLICERFQLDPFLQTHVNPDVGRLLVTAIFLDGPSRAH